MDNQNSQNSGFPADQNNPPGYVSLTNNPVAPQPQPTPNPYPTYNSAGFTPQPNQPSQEQRPESVIMSQKKPSFLIPLIFTLIFAVLVLAFGAGTYAVAYEKIKLPDKLEKTQSTISMFVQNLPYTPKTPKFVLGKSIIAQEKIEKETYNISMALDSDSFSSIPGLSTLDLEAKGAVDYSNPKDVKFSLNAFLTKDFNFEITRPSKLIYFKINKVPTLLMSMAGLKSNTFDSLLNKWYSYDPTPLETEARKDLGTPDNEVPSEKYASDFFDKVIDQEILSKMVMTKDSLDGFKVYKLTYDASPTEIDNIARKIEKAQKGGSMPDSQVENSQKLSDIVKSLKWVIYIDEKDFYIRKVSIVSQLETDQISTYDNMFLGTGSTPSGKSKVNVAFAAKFSDFGKDIKLSEPSGAGTWEDFTNAVSEIVMKQYESSYQSNYSSSMDSLKKFELSNIRSGLIEYKTVCGKYPQTLDDLTKTPKALGCSSDETPFLPVNLRYSEYFYELENKEKFHLCTKVTNPQTSTDNCPNPEYNYHISFP